MSVRGVLARAIENVLDHRAGVHDRNHRIESVLDRDHVNVGNDQNHVIVTDRSHVREVDVRDRVRKENHVTSQKKAKVYVNFLQYFSKNFSIFFYSPCREQRMTLRCLITNYDAVQF